MKQITRAVVIGSAALGALSGCAAPGIQGSHAGPLLSTEGIAYIQHEPEFAATDVGWADWDGDGDLEVAVSTSGGVLSSAAVFDRQGDAWVKVWESGEAERMEFLDWGDIDGDGDPDLIVGATYGTVQVLENVGGEFTLRAALPVDDKLHGLTWGEPFGAGDGRLALLLSRSRDGGAPSTWQLQGDELTMQWEDSGIFASSIEWGDIDGDGREELATGKVGAVRLMTWGDGEVPAVNSLPGSQRPVSFVELDGDEGTELVTGVAPSIAGLGGPLAIYEQGADGIVGPTLAEGPTAGPLRAGRYCPGEAPTLLSSSPARVTFGALGTRTPWSGPHTMRAAATWLDWDGDGRDEPLVIAAVGLEGAGALMVLEAATPTLAEAPGAPWFTEVRELTGVSFADWDLDGDPDVTLAPAGDRSLLILRNDDGEDRLVWQGGWGDYGTIDPVWGDLDGDGDLDLVAGTSLGGITVLRQDEAGFTRGWTSEEIPLLQVAVGDADGDGDLDLAGADSGIDRPNIVFLNDGTGVFEPGWEDPEPARTTALAWGDLDGDGRSDLAVGRGDGPVRVLRSTGDGFDPAWSDAQEDRVADLLWGDVDGDGDDDLLVAGRDVRLLENVDGALVPGWEAGTTGGVTELQLVDVDGDGDEDLFAARATPYGGGPDLIYLWQDGGFTLAWWGQYGVSGRSFVGDWDGDGGLDVRTQRSRVPSEVRPFVPLDSVEAWRPCEVASEDPTPPPSEDPPAEAPSQGEVACACEGGGISMLPLALLLGLGPRRRRPRA